MRWDASAPSRCRTVLAVLDRYSEAAQRLVNVAGTEARQLGHAHIGTEHLLLGLLIDRHNALATALPAGTTLHVVRRKVSEAVGANGAEPGQELLFTPRARRALERASRFSLQRHATQVEADHVLLGVLDVEGRAGQVLRGLGVDVGRLQQAADGTADQPARPPAAAPPADPPPTFNGPSTVASLRDISPRCSGCGAGLDAELSFQIRLASGEDGDLRRFVVAYCAACGSALGVTAE